MIELPQVESVAPTAGMTDAEKVQAFDRLALALTNRWWDGSWSWWNPSPCGGTATKRPTREEALKDLLAWAERMAARDAKRNAPLRKASEVTDE